MEENCTRQPVRKLLRRIIIYSVIAILSTFISTIIAALIDGASPIFLVGDTVINSICAVCQLTPIPWSEFKSQVKNKAILQKPTSTAIPGDGSKESKSNGHDSVVLSAWGMLISQQIITYLNLLTINL